MTDAADLVELLRERGWTIGIAESLTGGDVVSALVSVPRASAVVNGAVVAYATALKATLLGVDPETLVEHGAVHADVAAQMAVGVRDTVQVGGRRADVGIATTGIAGPDSPDGQPVGTVHIAIATPQDVHAVAFRFEGDRASIRAQATDAAIGTALALLRE